MGKKLPGYFIAVDVETTGIIRPGTEKDGQKPSQCISIALLVLDTHTLAEVDSYYSTIRFDPTRFDWSTQAEAVHGLSQAQLASSPDMATVARQVLQVIQRWLPPQEAKLFMGHNPSFDQSFTQQLMAEINEQLKFIHRALDAFSFGFAAFGLENSDEQFTFMDVDRSGVHNALDDIRLSVSMLRQVRKAGEAYRKQNQKPPSNTPIASTPFMAEYLRREAQSGDFRGIAIYGRSNKPGESKYVWVYYAGMGEDRYVDMEAEYIDGISEMLSTGKFIKGNESRRPLVDGNDEIVTPIETNFPSYDDKA